MKKNKDKINYYSGEALLKVNADINFICGEKGNGKSYWKKIHSLETFAKTGGRFVYLRRYDRDVTRSFVERYFNDIKGMEDITGGYNVVTANSGCIYLNNINAEGKTGKGELCGYYAPLATIQKRFASIPFINVNNIFLDEFAPLDGEYLDNEIFLFNVAISTILRRNANAKIFIIGNTFDRKSPYFREYGIEIEKLKQGTITTFKKVNQDLTEYTIAVDYCKNEVTNKNRLIGIGRESIINGDWYTEGYYRFPQLETFNVSYTFYIHYLNTIYRCRFMTKGREFAIYIDECIESDIPERSRHIDLKPNVDPLYTCKLLPLSEGERTIFNVLKSGKCFYYDDLVGTEFNAALKNFI